MVVGWLPVLSGSEPAETVFGAGVVVRSGPLYLLWMLEELCRPRETTLVPRWEECLLEHLSTHTHDGPLHGKMPGA